MVRFRSVQFLWREAVQTARRFPMVVLTSFVAAAVATVEIEAKVELADSRLLLTLLLGLPLFLSIDLFLESKKLVKPWHRWGGWILAASLLFFYFRFYAFDETDNFPLRFLQISLALHLLVSFSPFLAGESKDAFWQFNKSLFLRIQVAVLYSIVFFLGVSLAVLATDKLFAVTVNGERYFQIWVFSALVLQTWHFLAGVPQKRDEAIAYPKSLRFFVQYLLIPLVTLYMVILYIYMGKVIMTREWPSGYIGWLVSVMSVVGVLNLLLIEPEREKPRSRWIAVYAKYYYVFILPLLVLLFVALAKRVAAYGVTEKRYFLAVLGAWLTGLACYFIFSKKKNIRWVPVSLFFVTIGSLAGPWSAYEVSFRSQLGRAQEIMERNSLLAGGLAVRAKSSVSLQDKRQLSSVFDYIVQSHEGRTIRDWFPSGVVAALAVRDTSDIVLEPRKQTARAFMEHLGLSYVSKYSRLAFEYYHYRASMEGPPIEVGGFRQLAVLSSYQSTEIHLPEGTMDVKVDLEAAVVTLIHSGKKFTEFALGPLLSDLRAKKVKSGALLPQIALQVSGEGEESLLYIQSISVGYEDGRPSLRGVKGIILLP